VGTNSKTTHQSYTVTPSLKTTLAGAADDLDTADVGAAVPEPLPADMAQQLMEELFGPDGSPQQSAPVELGAEALPPGDAPEAEPAPAEVLKDAPGTTEAPGEVTETAQETEPDRDRWPDALLEVPQAPPEGLATGVPVLIGGEDLTDSTATLMAYASEGEGGPREVLFATVTEDTEAKLLESLDLSDKPMVAVQMTQQVDGRLPLDEDKQLYELVKKAATSVNHKLDNDIEIPEHTKEYLAKAQAAVDAVAGDPNIGPAEAAMAADYASKLEQIKARIDGTTTDKVPLVLPHTHTGETTVTTYVPAPSEPGAGLPANLRDASRIGATIDPATGTSSWNGIGRDPAKGKEYLIDLGDGYTAVYRPYGENDIKKHEYSLRGQLEVHAPQGAGHGQDLVQRLGQLHLVNRPMTAAEGEWTYLQSNITAQGLHKFVGPELNKARHMEDLELQEIFHERAHQAIGLDQDGLQRLAKDFQLEAAARCLPKKVNLVREAVAKASGFSSGAELAAHPGYEPAPTRSGGWLTWSRWDVTKQPEAIHQAFEGKSLVHGVSGGNIADLFTTGTLASTERRALMGVAKGKGMSEHADKYSGGANSVFLRVKHTPSHGGGPALVWDDPAVLMRRSDYYGYDGDHFGAVNPASGHSISGQTRDPFKIAKFGAGGNEIMLRNGIDLTGAEAPSRILCGSATEKKKLLDLFALRGITHLGDKHVNDVVQA
jgi:hypothetical protein